MSSQVCEPAESISAMDDVYWNLRAEVVPEEQLQHNLGEGDRIIHVYHFNQVGTRVSPQA